MSTLHVEEYSSVLKDVNGDLCDVPHILLGRTQVSFTTSSARTGFDFDAMTTFVILHSDADSYILLGDSTVTVDQTGVLLPSGVFRSFGIQQGAKRVAVIQKT